MSIENTNGADTSSPEIRSGGTPPPSAAPKRGPGRPRKDQANGASPGGLGETPIGAETAKPRGRPKKERVELDKGAVARQLMGSHMMMASMLGLPELILTEKQADSMADALIDFSREYDWQPDPKVMASFNLIATAGFIYTPKVLAIVARIKKARAGKGQTIDGTAVEVPPTGHGDTPAN